MNYRPAALYVDFDDDTLPNVAAATGACRPTVDVDDADDSAEEDVVGALTQRVCSSASPVDLLHALPASCETAIPTDDVTSPPPTSSTTRTLMLSPRPMPCCRTRDVQRRWNTHVATVPLASDVACTCAGWVSSKPTQYSPPTPFPAPPPVPQRTRSIPTDRRRRIDDAYSTYSSGNLDVADVELTASLSTRHYDCFRLCCFRSSRSSKPEQKTTGTTELVGLTTVCRCSALVDSGNGNRSSRLDELNSKRTRSSRRRHVTHVLIACIVALPVTCLGLLGLFLMLSPLYQSTTGKLHLARHTSVRAGTHT